MMANSLKRFGTHSMSRSEFKCASGNDCACRIHVSSVSGNFVYLRVKTPVIPSENTHSQIATLIRETFAKSKWAEPILKAQQRALAEGSKQAGSAPSVSSHTPARLPNAVRTSTWNQNDRIEPESVKKSLGHVKISMNDVSDPDNDKYGKSRSSSVSLIPSSLRHAANFFTINVPVNSLEADGHSKSL